MQSLGGLCSRIMPDFRGIVERSGWTTLVVCLAAATKHCYTMLNSSWRHQAWPPEHLGGLKVRDSLQAVGRSGL